MYTAGEAAICGIRAVYGMAAGLVDGEPKEVVR